jgi:flavorubredoxin
VAGTGGLPRELAPGIQWLGNCIVYETDFVAFHSYNSVYVVSGSERTLIVDTGFPKDWRIIDRHLDELLADGLPPVAWLCPTHSEVAHAGNLGRLLQKFPAATVRGDIRDYHLYYPGLEQRFEPARVGTALELGGRRIVFEEAPFKDLVTTLWLFDEQERVLFTGDGFSYAHYHPAEHCGSTAEELGDIAIPELTALFSYAAFYFTKYTDLAPIIERFERQLERLGARTIAPGHGCPITDLGRTVPKAVEGLRLGQELSLEEVFAAIAAHQPPRRPRRAPASA